MVRAQFLQSHALFGGICDEDIKKIRPLLREEHFSKGEFIFKQGEVGDRLYFLYEGSVEILSEIRSPTGVAQTRLAVLGKGDTFGEMVLIDLQHRSASVRALEEVSALTLSNRDIYQIYKNNLKAYTMIIMNIAREISRRLRKMDALVGSSLYARPHEKDGSQGKTGPAGGGVSQ